MTTDNRPVITLERNNAGTLFIGVVEFDDAGYGVRAYVLSMADKYTADSVMQRRYDDMLKLMDGNVRTTLPGRT